MKYRQYYGKYRAIVTQVESNKLGTRLKVKCPSVLGESPSAWCNPCIPFLYTEHKLTCETGGFHHTYLVPKVGDPVWIEFEGGDLSKPIWVGTWR